MSWADVEDAVQSAVEVASGLDPGQVVWTYQNVNEPALDHATINFLGPLVVGIDRVETTTDLTRALGQEIKVEVKGVREVSLEIQVFTKATSGDGAARYLADLIRTRLRLPSIRFGLQRAGVGVFDLGPVQWVPDIPSTTFRGRAICEVRCYVPVADCVEYSGYIARVRGVVYPTGFAGATFGASGIPFDTGAVG